MIRAPLKIELEEQLAATVVASNRLGNKARSLKGAVKRCKRADSKARAQENYDRVSDLYEEALEQARSLENLIKHGRDDSAPSYEIEFNEHQEVNVEYYSYSRQQEDMRDALEWLAEQEEKHPGFGPGGAARWVSARISDARRRERAKLVEIAKAAQVIIADNKRLSAKEERNQRRIRELGARVKRLEARIKDQNAELGQFRVQPNVDAIIAQRNILRTDVEELKASVHTESTLKRVAKNRVRDLEVEVSGLTTKIGHLEEDLRVARQEFSGAQARMISRQRDDLMKANNVLQEQTARLLQERGADRNYQILRNENERLAAEAQRLTRENTRLEEHIDRISGRSR